MFGYTSFHCDPDLKDGNLIFWHETPAHDGTPAYQVWLQKAEQFRRYRPHKTQTDGHWFKYTNVSADLKKWISGCSLRWIVNTLSEYFANTSLFQSSSPVHLSKPAHNHFSFVLFVYIISSHKALWNRTPTSGIWMIVSWNTTVYIYIYNINTWYLHVYTTYSERKCAYW